MKKILMGALVAGAIVLPLTNAEAYHVIKQHKNAEPVAVTQPATVTKQQVLQQPAVTANNETLSATASAHTDRSLVSQEAPASVRNDVAAPVVAPIVPAKQGYLMRGGDQLQLIVYGHDDISTKLGTAYTPYVVRPDGYLTLPLIGEVYVQNKTVAEVTKEVSDRLAEYIIDPQVTINVTKLGTTRVYVLGETKNQGTFELSKSHNLIDAVGAAGGFTNKAAKRNVYLVRNGVPDFVTKVNILDLLKHADAKCNPMLNEGDMVYISSNHKIKFTTEILPLFSAFLNLEEGRYYRNRANN